MIAPVELQRVDEVWDAGAAEAGLTRLDSKVAALAWRLHAAAASFGVLPHPTCSLEHSMERSLEQPLEEKTTLEASCGVRPEHVNVLPPMEVLLRTLQAKCHAEQAGATARSELATERIHTLVARADAERSHAYADSAEAQAIIYADAAAHATVTAAMLHHEQLATAFSARQAAAGRRIRRPKSRARSRPSGARAATPQKSHLRSRQPGWRT
jgi:hypothetical protein